MRYSVADRKSIAATRTSRSLQDVKSMSPNTGQETSNGITAQASPAAATQDTDQ
ncbi:unnamed protein product, partial [Nesidiocoris tenuis]